MQTLAFSNWRKALSTNKDVSIVPFHWGHAQIADLRDYDKKYFDVLPDFNDRLKMYSAGDLACTAMYRGEIACCFGVITLWCGVAEAWMLTTDHVATAPVSLTKGAFRYFNLIATTLELRRLQLTVNQDNELAINWANALNFAPEGVMKQYGPEGSNYVMYARYFK